MTERTTIVTAQQQLAYQCLVAANAKLKEARDLLLGENMLAAADAARSAAVFVMEAIGKATIAQPDTFQ